MTRALLAAGLLLPALALAAMRPTEVRQMLDVPGDTRAMRAAGRSTRTSCGLLPCTVSLRRCTGEALAEGLKQLLEKGYRFVKLSDMAVRAIPRR